MQIREKKHCNINKNTVAQCKEACYAIFSRSTGKLLGLVNSHLLTGIKHYSHAYPEWLQEVHKYKRPTCSPTSRSWQLFARGEKDTHSLLLHQPHIWQGLEKRAPAQTPPHGSVLQYVQVDLPLRKHRVTLDSYTTLQISFEGYQTLFPQENYNSSQCIIVYMSNKKKSRFYPENNYPLHGRSQSVSGLKKSESIDVKCSSNFPRTGAERGDVALSALRDPAASKVFFELMLSAPMLWPPALCSDEASLATHKKKETIWYR